MTSPHDAHHIYDGPHPAVEYWSVPNQRWIVTHTRGAVPARDYAALPERDRALLDELPAR